MHRPSTIEHLPRIIGAPNPPKTALWELDYDGDPISWWPKIPHWRIPRRVLVNIDTILDADTPEWLAHTFFQEIETASQHIFQVLTTHTDRLHSIIVDREQHKRDYADAFNNNPIPARRTCPAADDARRRAGTPPVHIWVGVAVTNQHDADARIPALLNTPAAVRFADVDEHTPIELDPWITSAACPACRGWRTAVGHTCDLDLLDWVTMSTSGAQPANPDWAHTLRDLCGRADIPCDISPAPNAPEVTQG